MNKEREIIPCNSIIKDLKESDSRIPIALGKSTFGSHVIIDLMECHNLLIAGDPESGKTTLFIFPTSTVFSEVLKCINYGLMNIIFQPIWFNDFYTG